MENPEQAPDSRSKLEQKEGRFHGGIKFRSEQLGVDTTVPEGRRLLTSLVFDTDGTPKIKKGLYDSSKIPEKIDPADFDYDDNAMAEYYDSSPEISIIDIDPTKADELLAQRQQELEQSLKEFDALEENAEDEMEGEKIEMARSPIEHDLEQVKIFRTKLKK
ncbi:MAG: hypothetical protein HYY55_04190 [Candidatus Niyogibacteria bacterium]|nr:MAG: hypothetical protein HYY55_04190 [Candidatus Niyogibacteria bacterium]